MTKNNWFFRLSRYTGELLAALQSGRVRVEPVTPPAGSAALSRQFRTGDGVIAPPAPVLTRLRTAA